MEDSRKASGVTVVTGPKSKGPLFVTFGGIHGNISMPPLEFLNIMSTNFPECSIIYIVDHWQAWYYKGVKGFSFNQETTSSELRKLIGDMSYDQTIFMGTSMGGYAAILHGILLGADTVLAFTPQTFINPEKRTVAGDMRWYTRLKPVWEYAPDHEWFDLSTMKNKGTNIQIFYSTSHHLDTLHAKNVAHLATLNDYEVPKKYVRPYHTNVVKALKEMNQLAPLIKSYVNVPI